MANERYYVDFYDMFDGWGGWGFWTERLFNDLEKAKECCRKLQSELDESNIKAGEHYGVIDKNVNREVYCMRDVEFSERLGSESKKWLDRL